MLDYQEPKLDTDQQKQAAAAAVEGLPADSEQQLVTNVV